MTYRALRHDGLSPINWAELTGLLNVIALILVVLGMASALSSGALGTTGLFPTTHTTTPRNDLPDVYLLMLDGYPRADTLARDFDFDDTPFLDDMRGLGFEVADRSHSNYNLTVLTLASMMNARHIDDLLADPPADAPGQYRALSHLINDGMAIETARALGYEIVTIPSPFSVVTMYDADRVIDSGQVTELELDILQEGVLPRILPGVQRDWLLGQHRSRVTRTFGAMAGLAAERDSPARLIFGHVMAPHPPSAFAADGSPEDGWGCFPETCTMWDGGQSADPDDVRRLMAGQVAFVNQRVLETVSAIIKDNQRPSVIVVFSDHGYRFDFGDHQEALHDLIISYTPGHRGLFPADATPMNILPRILNSYADADLPMASEESYWIPSWLTRTQGLFPLEPTDP